MQKPPSQERRRFWSKNVELLGIEDLEDAVERIFLRGRGSVRSRGSGRSRRRRSGRGRSRSSSLGSSRRGRVEAGSGGLRRSGGSLLGLRLARLVERLGGMEIYFHASGIGSRNTELRPDIEIATLRTNGEGFVRMVTAAFSYFRAHGGGHLAVISSIAGTRGLGSAPAYSATKRMQNTYIDALAQLSRMEGYGIRFTDIRPGFVATPLLDGEGHYPMLMPVEKVAARIMRILRRPRRRAVIDRRYAAMVFFWRLIPQWLWERLKVRVKE